jgi:hypothetical protein
MDPRYAEWIAANVEGDGYGQCREVTERMAAAFPELARVRGHYYCLIWGEREHWWLTTPAGEIVDPTAAQFPSKGHGEYVPWIEGTPEPTGLCPQCGEYVYDGNTCCSDACSRAYAAYCMNPW